MWGKEMLYFTTTSTAGHLVQYLQEFTVHKLQLEQLCYSDATTTSALHFSMIYSGQSFAENWSFTCK